MKTKTASSKNRLSIQPVPKEDIKVGENQSQVRYIKDIYNLDTYRRSNQDTCLMHKPALTTGEWVESGDLIADNSASMNGELAIGKNILVAYMPWEGYNYEDSILINERLVYDDAYTSVHIERYEIEIREGQQGSEQITKDIPDLKPKETAHLDNSGIVKIGSWIEEGDILVGKITPVNPKKQTGYQRLIFKLFDKKPASIRDSSLRAPKGMKANVINVQIFESAINNPEGLVTKSLAVGKRTKKSQKHVGQKSSQVSSGKKTRGLTTLVPSPTSGKSQRDFAKRVFPLTSNLNPAHISSKAPGRNNQHLSNASRWLNVEKPMFSKHLTNAQQISTTQTVYYDTAYVLKTKLDKSKKRLMQSKSYRTTMPVPSNLEHKSNSLPLLQKNLTRNIIGAHIYLAETRKIQVGDKMAGRHGNKGIISNILPRQDMPYLPDGTALDIVLNPLGVPSRMNVGQIFECLLGLAGKYLGEHYKVYAFDELYGAEASRSFVFGKLFEARQKTGIDWLFTAEQPGKMRIFDGRTDESFDQPVTVGIAYMLKLVHMVDDKIHARNTGPYSLVTQQPLKGRAKQGGQRLGEMEVWAIEGFGAAFVLLEMLTLKSDDMTGRLKLWSNLILGEDITIGTPESFKVLVCELQALCLDIGLYTNPPRKLNKSKSRIGEADRASTNSHGVVGRQTKKASFKKISHLMFMP